MLLLALLAAGPPVLADRLVLDTARHELTLVAGTATVARYRVGLGSAGSGKQLRGDQKTPLGRYRLLAGRDSKFHRFLPVSYPNAADAARGRAAGHLSRSEHDAILRATRAGRLPPQDTRLGGAIGIHGLGRAFRWLPAGLQSLHRVVDATDGCILLTDREVVDLERRYRPGAELWIR